MHLGLYGSTDKRPLVYALFKLLQNYGDICFLTKNRQHLRLSDTHESGGHFQNVMIVVTDLSYDEIWEEISQNPHDFQHVIYDMDQDFPNNLDLTIVCRTMVKADGEDEHLNWIHSDKEEVKFDYDGARPGFFAGLFSKKNNADEIQKISMEASLWKFVETSEACRIIPPVPDCGILEVLSGKIADILDLTVDEVKTLIKEGEEM